MEASPDYWWCSSELHLLSAVNVVANVVDCGVCDNAVVQQAPFVFAAVFRPKFNLLGDR